MPKKTKAVYTITSTYDIQRDMIFTLSEGVGRNVRIYKSTKANGHYIFWEYCWGD